MSQIRLITAFDRLSEADFHAKAGFILNSLTGNADFPEPWPALVPSLARLQEAYLAYRDAYHASLMRDRQRIIERTDLRQKLTRMLQQLAAYLELAADGDIVRLSKTGYDLRRESGRPSGSLPSLLEAPQDFRIGPGPRSGTLQLQATRLPGAVAYEIQTNLGQPDNESDWHQVLIVPSVRRVIVEGLAAGQVWVRLRGINKAGNGYWSIPISVLMV